MKNRKSTIILLVSFFVGLSILLYPAISSFWNAKTQSKVVVDYEAMLARIEAEDFTRYFDEADEYNAQLRELSSPFQDHEELEE